MLIVQANANIPQIVQGDIIVKNTNDDMFASITKSSNLNSIIWYDGNEFQCDTVSVYSSSLYPTDWMNSLNDGLLCMNCQTWPPTMYTIPSTPNDGKYYGITASSFVNIEPARSPTTMTTYQFNVQVSSSKYKNSVSASVTVSTLPVLENGVRYMATLNLQEYEVYDEKTLSFSDDIIPMLHIEFSNVREYTPISDIITLRQLNGYTVPFLITGAGMLPTITLQLYYMTGSTIPPRLPSNTFKCTENATLQVVAIDQVS